MLTCKSLKINKIRYRIGFLGCWEQTYIDTQPNTLFSMQVLLQLANTTAVVNRRQHISIMLLGKQAGERCQPHAVCVSSSQSVTPSPTESSSSLSAVTMARVETSSTRPYHLVIFGASGFTGQFVVEEVARTASEGPKGNLKWAVAGRSQQKLEKVLEQAAGFLSMYLSNRFVHFEADCFQNLVAPEIVFSFIQLN